MCPAGARRREGTAAFGGNGPDPVRGETDIAPCRIGLSKSFVLPARPPFPYTVAAASAFEGRDVGWIPEDPRGRPPFRSGGWAAGSCRRCFTDRIGRIAHGNRPSAREPGRFRPDVSQFVDAEPTGPDRRLERRRNPPLRRELLNTAKHICLREPGRKPEPSVIATMGMVIVLAALLLRTSPGIHLRFDTERNARLVTCAGGSPGNPTPEVISRCRRPFWGEFAHT